MAIKSEREKPKINFGDHKAVGKQNESTPEEQAEGAARIEAGFMAVTTHYSPLAAVVSQKFSHVVQTTSLDTMAVAMRGDGTIFMMYNPTFISKLDAPTEDTVFGELHEIYHVVLGDLWNVSQYAGNQTMVIATETVINHVTLKRMARKTLPTITVLDANGKPRKESIGVDPKKVYKDYAADVNDPVDYDTFVSSAPACYAELMRMKTPPGSNGGKKIKVCVHGAGDGSGDGDIPADAETGARVSREALEKIMQDAHKGDSRARDEIMDLAAASEGTERGGKFWGDLGIGSLRGESVKARKVEWWARWLRRTLGSKLKAGDGLVYPRKLGGIWGTLGFDVPMLHRGPEKTKRVARVVDTSGSMSQEVLERFFKLTGSTRNVEWIDLSHDAVVMPYKAGERVYGGGGTSFQVVVDYLEGRDTVNGAKFDGKFDAVIMFTDGYAPEVQPKDPKKWIWLITEGGSNWMDGKMDWHFVDIPD